jgi:hypothetical protein
VDVGVRHASLYYPELGERTGTDLSEGLWPYSHLDLGLPASRMVTVNVCCLSHSVPGTLFHLASQTNTGNLSLCNACL